MKGVPLLLVSLGMLVAAPVVARAQAVFGFDDVNLTGTFLTPPQTLQADNDPLLATFDVIGSVNPAAAFQFVENDSPSGPVFSTDFKGLALLEAETGSFDTLKITFNHPIDRIGFDFALLTAGHIRVAIPSLAASFDATGAINSLPVPTFQGALSSPIGLLPFDTVLISSPDGVDDWLIDTVRVSLAPVPEPGPAASVSAIAVVFVLCSIRRRASARRSGAS